MGRATAERLAEAGANLFISARRGAEEISSKYNAKVTPVVADSSTQAGRNVVGEQQRIRS